MPQADPRRVATVDPHHAAQVIGDFCAHHGGPRLDGFTADQAVELLDRMGYAINLGTVAEFIRKGYVGDPGESWSPVAVYCLTAALEARRRWTESPDCPHNVKKTGIRLQIEQLRSEGVEPVNDLDRHTVEDLLLQLAGSDNRAERECLYEVLRLKLADYEE